jgi:pyrroline-5-carboxylate reductase
MLCVTILEVVQMVLSVIGTGQMGQALIQGMIQNQAIEPDNVWLYDSDKAKVTAIAEQYGAHISQSAEQAASQGDLILIAVKPAVVANVLETIRPVLTTQIVLSIAAGITLSDLRGWAGDKPALARIMPNTPAKVGAAVSAVCFDQTSEAQRQDTLNLLSACGRVFTVNESSMDAVTGLSGSGPAYIMLVIEALADGGVLEGLPRDMALEMAAMTVYGAAKMVLDTQTHPAVLKDQVCSPGGTTIRAVDSLESDGLRSALIRAVSAAADRSRQMGKKHG